jgi:hypothetical protein
MKKISSLLVFGLALLLSCEKEGPTTVNEITDLYTAPAGAKEMTFTGGESTWSTDRRYFDLKFSDLTTTLVGYDAFLAPGLYLLGGDEIGKAIAAKTKVGGQTPSEGWITVNNRDGKYQFTAQFGDQVYFWAGSLPFQADPAPLDLTVLQQASANKDSKLVTLQLATEGISQGYDENWQQVWTGEGKYLAIDLYSEDGYLHDGLYRASAQGGVVNSGEFGIGYDAVVDWGWGPMEMKDWGTCLWTVSGGKATAEKITSGLVNVASREEKVDGKDVTIWTITWGAEYPVEVVFEGAVPTLTKPKRPDGPVALDYTYTIGDPMDCSTQAGDVVAGVKKYPFNFVDAAGEQVAYLEFILVDGAADVVPGDYVSTEYAHEPGQLANGYFMDFGDWGTFSGGSWYVNGAGEKVFIDPGVTVSVEAVGTGAFKFASDGFLFAAAGPNYLPGGDEGDDDVTGDVVLKLTSGLTYTMEDVTAGNTAADGSALSGMTLWRVSVLNGADEVAEFDLGTAEGSQDLAGTYTVMSYPDAVGKAGNGWGFIPWMKGGCYFVVEGNYYWIPSDSTIKVSNNADGTLKIKFEGAIQNSDNTDGGQGGLLLNNIAKS